MGFFNRSNTDSQPENSTNWNIITSDEEVSDVFHESDSRMQVIFKHSPRCGVSFLAKQNMDAIKAPENVDFHLIDVVGQRAISQHISQKTGIRHESPQVFVVDRGEVIWSGSHYQVSEDNVLKVLNRI